jgi:hypothetical protein
MATLLESRAGAAELGVPLMITSFLVVAGFMYWLSVTAEPTEIVLAEPEELFENAVTFPDFAAGPGEYVGQLVSLEGIEVGYPYGNHFRWINLPDANNNSYLLHFSDSLRADTTFALSSVSQGMTVSVTGAVVETTDSVVDAWEVAGAFKSEVEKLVVHSTYYLNFIEVTRIELPETTPPGQGDGSGSG